MGVPDRFAEFVHLVSKMRDAQRIYFRSRSISDMRHAMQLESHVDQFIKTHSGRGTIRTDSQPVLGADASTDLFWDDVPGKEVSS